MFILVLKGKSLPGSAISTERVEAVDKKYCVTSRCLVPGLVYPLASLVSWDPG